MEPMDESVELDHEPESVTSDANTTSVLDGAEELVNPVTEIKHKTATPAEANDRSQTSSSSGLASATDSVPPLPAVPGSVGELGTDESLTSTDKPLEKSTPVPPAAGKGKNHSGAEGHLESAQPAHAVEILAKKGSTISGETLSAATAKANTRVDMMNGTKQCEAGSSILSKAVTDLDKDKLQNAKVVSCKVTSQHEADPGKFNITLEIVMAPNRLPSSDSANLALPKPKATPSTSLHATYPEEPEDESQQPLRKRQRTTAESTTPPSKTKTTPKTTSTASKGKTTSPKAVKFSTTCQDCRIKKRKCSGERPTCANCKRGNLECSWPPSSTRNKGPIDRSGVADNMDEIA